MKNKAAMIYFTALAIFIFVLAFRIYFAAKITGVSGGDAYNNLFIARYIYEGQNPFEGARRLPFYPLLLVPTQFLGIDPILYSRIVSSIAGSAIAVVIYLFASSFGLSIFSSAVISLLAGMSPSSLFVSVRPLSNSTFAFLATLSIYLFYKIYKEKKLKFSYTLSVVMGFLSMTRHEGFIISAILILFLAVKAWNGKRIKELIISLIPYALIVLPFFINNLITFKKLFYSDYLEYPEGLWMPQNFNEARRNYQMIINIIPAMWFSSDKYLILGKLLSFMSIFGIVFFAKKQKALSIPLIVIVISQILISYWYQPTIRYWLQIIPFIIFFSVFGFETIFSKLKSLRYIYLSASMLLVVLSVVSTYHHMSGTVRDLNMNTTGEYLLRKALLDNVKSTSGKIGLPADYPQAIYFLKDRGVYYTTRPPKNDPIETQEKWIKDNRIQYLIIPSEHDFLDIVRVKNYDRLTEYREGKYSVVVYKVK